jgi:hypothetical protein
MTPEMQLAQILSSKEKKANAALSKPPMPAAATSPMGHGASPTAMRPPTQGGTGATIPASPAGPGSMKPASIPKMASAGKYLAAGALGLGAGAAAGHGLGKKKGRKQGVGVGYYLGRMQDPSVRKSLKGAKKGDVVDLGHGMKLTKKSDMIKKTSAEKIAMADQVGRDLARAVMEKTAIPGVGAMAGTALRAVTRNSVGRNSLVGAGVGAAGGAVKHMASNDPNSSLLGNMAGGAALGAGAGALARPGAKMLLQQGATRNAAGAATGYAKTGPGAWARTQLQGANTAARRRPGSDAGCGEGSEAGGGYARCRPSRRVGTA